MASLSDLQLDSEVVAEGIEHCWALPGWWYVSQPLTRYDARFVSRLTPDQLRRAQEPAGLPFKELTAAQQQAAIEMEQARVDAMERQGSNLQSVTPEEWPRAEIVISYVPDGWYAWERSGDSGGSMVEPTGPYGGRTPEAALASVRREYAAASAAGVKYCRGGLFRVGLRFRSSEPLKPAG